MLETLAIESKKAKQLLRDYGFGVSGTNLLLTVEDAVAEIEVLREIAELYYASQK